MRININDIEDDDIFWCTRYHISSDEHIPPVRCRIRIHTNKLYDEYTDKLISYEVDAENSQCLDLITNKFISWLDSVTLFDNEEEAIEYYNMSINNNIENIQSRIDILNKEIMDLESLKVN